MDGRREVCLAEEAERLRRSGLQVGEIARRMGVDSAWVETVITTGKEDEGSEPEDN